MTSRSLVFLLGGSEAFDVVAAEFVPAAGGCDARIAVLLQSGEGWSKHWAEYTQPWARRGVLHCEPIVPDNDGRLDMDAVSRRLRQATGVFLGGGHTPTYHRLYAAEPIRSILRERYYEGVPVAGVSAGALISLETCPVRRGSPDPAVLPTDRSPEAFDTFQHLPGLGLVSDVMVSAHFTERQTLSELLEAMARTRTRTGLGIDGGACAVSEAGDFKGVLGQSVYEITMEDFETRAHRVVECATAYSRYGPP